ncbi:unnamed protein product [Rangifer tarandus platyrhynchus]|uniref:Uncharacterized protein n=1 Tax=Rangifer tarandus platyrhynchus TaxID=3082113 RepID=A0ABN8ZWM6_RANTA|nr:unnamed protein product [Rangifer tarandus platyrhynchus]
MSWKPSVIPNNGRWADSLGLDKGPAWQPPPGGASGSGPRQLPAVLPCQLERTGSFAQKEEGRRTRGQSGQFDLSPPLCGQQCPGSCIGWARCGFGDRPRLSPSSEPGAQLQSPQAAAAEGCILEPALGHGRRLFSEKPVRHSSGAAPSSATQRALMEREEIVVLRKASSSGFPLPCAKATSVTASEDVSARVHICGPVKPQTTECEQAPVARTPGPRCAGDHRRLPQEAGSRVTSADHTEQRGMVRQSGGLTPATPSLGDKLWPCIGDRCPATSRELALLPGSPSSRLARPQCPRLTDSILGAAHSRDQRVWAAVARPAQARDLLGAVPWDTEGWGERESPSPQSGAFLPVFSQGRSLEEKFPLASSARAPRPVSSALVPGLFSAFTSGLIADELCGGLPGSLQRLPGREGSEGWSGCGPSLALPTKAEGAACLCGHPTRWPGGQVLLLDVRMEAQLACCGMLCGPSGLFQNRAQTVMALTRVLLLDVRSEAQLAGRGMLCEPGGHKGQPGSSRAWACGPGVVSASVNYPGCQGNHGLSGTIWGDKEALWKVPSCSGRGEAADHVERAEGAFSGHDGMWDAVGRGSTGTQSKDQQRGQPSPQGPCALSNFIVGRTLNTGSGFARAFHGQHTQRGGHRHCAMQQSPGAQPLRASETLPTRQPPPPCPSRSLQPPFCSWLL